MNHPKPWRDYPQYERKRFVALVDEAPVHGVRITRYVPESIADGTGGYGYNAAHGPARSQPGDAFEGRNPDERHTAHGQAGPVRLVVPGFADSDSGYF